jgi:hypothetical protein
MSPTHTELLDHAIMRLVDLPPEEQDRMAIEILADLCSEEEWALLAASEPYHDWLATQPENKPQKSGASLLSPAG